MTYGVPYQGSKNSIAKEIVDFLPASNTLVDMFAGGCAITHAAMLSGKYERIIANDANPMPTQLFFDALNGKYKNERRWVSRDDFYKLKDTDPYVKYVWSFGNNGEDYLYAKEIEGFKHAMHVAIYDGSTALLEQETGIKNIPCFEGEADPYKRYTLLRRWLESRIGGAQGGDAVHGAVKASSYLQSFRQTRRLSEIGKAYSHGKEPETE